MKNLEIFKRMIDEEVVIIGDDRFVFDHASLSDCNTAYFYFKLGTLCDAPCLKLDFLDSDELFMKYNAAKLTHRAYGSLIRKIESNYCHILRDLVDEIEDVTKKIPIKGFEVIGVDYRHHSSALINFKLFGYGVSFGVDLESMESFGGAEKYAKCVVGRVISEAAETMIDDAKRG